jgi:hypothetical protein
MSADASPVSFRLRARHRGGHWHVGVWSSEFGAETTHGRNGILVFREAEWVAFRQQFAVGAGAVVEITEDDDRDGGS